MKKIFQVTLKKEKIEKILKEYIFSGQDYEFSGMIAENFCWNSNSIEVQIDLKFNRSIR